jgi:hypothetical protein
MYSPPVGHTGPTCHEVHSSLALNLRKHGVLGPLLQYAVMIVSLDTVITYIISDKKFDKLHLRVLRLELLVLSSGVPRIFFRGGGVQQIQWRAEDRENGDLGA